VADASGNGAGTCLILLGGPGAGKGTQAARLAARLGIPRISTGDMLREAMRQGSEVGRRAAPFLERGDLVPDRVLLDVVKKRLEEPDCAAGYILDGFPRTVAQAESFGEVLEGRGAGALVIHVDVPREELSRRLLARGRDDDQASIVKRRLDEYQHHTAPLIDYYRGRLRFERVDGMQPVEAISEEILAVLSAGPRDGQARG
jgi:adenylate kinase